MLNRRWKVHIFHRSDVLPRRSNVLRLFCDSFALYLAGVLLSAISRTDYEEGDGRNAFLLILDAQTMVEIARADFGVPRFPKDLHGIFSPTQWHWRLFTKKKTKKTTKQNKTKQKQKTKNKKQKTKNKNPKKWANTIGYCLLNFGAEVVFFLSFNTWLHWLYCTQNVSIKW